MINHSKCDHPSTPAARSKCRKAQATGETPTSATKRPSRGVTTTRVEPQLLDMSDATQPGLSPKIFDSFSDSLLTPEERQRRFLRAVHKPGRLADERNKARIQYEEDVASGKRRPFYRKRRVDTRPSMFWIDEKKGK